MATIKFRRATAAAATSSNPVLAAGEPGFETDTGKLKIGDGTAAWNSLAYVSGGSVSFDSLGWKQPVKVATTANITLSGTQTIDGVAVIAGDRVLVKDQSTGSQNGIYVCAAGAWSRSDDASTAAEVEGMAVLVQQGTAGGNKLYIQTADSVTLGTTSLVFSQVVDLSGYAPLASPTFTGTPAGPTAAQGTNTTQVATTAYVQTEVALKEDVLDTLSVDTSGGTITLNFASKNQRVFYGSASFTGSKTVAYSNSTNAKVYNFHISVTTSAAITFPTGSTMDSNESRWNSGSRILTLTGTGDYLISAVLDPFASEWRINASSNGGYL